MPIVPNDPAQDTDRHLLGPARAQLRLLQVWGGDKDSARPVPPSEGPHGVVGGVPLTVEQIIARVHLGELRHLRHRVAAGRRGADGGLGTRDPRPPQPGDTRGVTGLRGVTPGVTPAGRCPSG